MATREPASDQGPAWFGHPRGLYVLFFAEMWERFSFYGMRALLVFYLTKHFLFSDAHAAGLYATYGALVYLAPVLGGLIADRYLGFRRAVVFGAALLCVGHAGMAFEGFAATLDAQGQVQRDELALSVLYGSLAFIIVGVGLLKPSISSIVGQLYGPEDERRDSGFTLFYMGINLGAMTASLVCGYLGETYGWAYGFGAAGVGMFIGLITFVRGSHLLGSAGRAPDEVVSGQARTTLLRSDVAIYLGSLLAVVGVWQLVQHQQVVGTLLSATSGAVVLGVMWFSLMRENKVERDRMLAVLILIAISVVFWSLFEQAGSSLNLFADRNVDRQLFGLQIKASQLQSLNPLFIILLAPLFALLWPALARRGLTVSTPMKFGLAVLQVGLGFFALVYGASLAGSDGQVALLWLVLAYFLHTTGELCLSPVGLAMVTRLSVPRVVGLMMGVWFLSSSVSHYVAGLIAQMASVEEGAAALASDSLGIYSETFLLVAQIAAVIGALVLLLSPSINKLTHESRPRSGAQDDLSALAQRDSAEAGSGERPR
ncbi:MAG: peptide MFS transporter [Pseudomonadales bacterium]